MSWQDYIDDSLIASGNVSGGALIGLDGNLWARSETLSRISREEIDNLIKGFTPEGLLQLRNNGCFIAQEKYMVIKGDERSIYIKKGQGGAAMVQTNKCLVLGIYVDGMAAGSCNLAVERLAEYFIESGY